MFQVECTRYAPNTTHLAHAAFQNVERPNDFAYTFCDPDIIPHANITIGDRFYAYYDQYSGQLQVVDVTISYADALRYFGDTGLAASQYLAGRGTMHCIAGHVAAYQDDDGNWTWVFDLEDLGA